MLAVEIADEKDVPFFWDKQAAIGWWEQRLHDTITQARAAARAAAGGAADAPLAPVLSQRPRRLHHGQYAHTRRREPTLDHCPLRVFC